jgi:hypothetical protein
MTPAHDKLLAIIQAHRGAHNAIHWDAIEETMRRWGFKRSRSMIREMREELWEAGKLTCSTQDGLFVPRNRQEAYEALRQYRAKINDMLHKASLQEKIIEDYFANQLPGTEHTAVVR